MALPPLIAGLLDSAAYSESPAKVSLIQTHISYILLTPDMVYKIKKPVDFGFLDFTTLEKRRFYCNEEVRLNRRLTHGIYIGVVPVSDLGGKPRMEGDGAPVEYAVKMRHIPEETMLRTMILSGAPGPALMERIGARIADFHLNVHTESRIAAFGSPGAIRNNLAENFSQTEAFIGRTISKERFELIKESSLGFLAKHAPLFTRRMEEGFIKDCHGDIHSDHISIDNGINIIDCIEFNERFRYSDSISDLAFLLMDLDYLSRGDLARALEESYLTASGDGEGGELLDFYRSYRAYVRGKVESFRLDEEEVPPEDKASAARQAKRYFHLAEGYALSHPRPVFVLVRGLSGSGKSTLAEALSSEAGLLHLSSDRIRKELAGMDPLTHDYKPFGRGIYSGEATERTYGEIIGRAGRALRAGRSVVVDATFLKKTLVERVRSEAQSSGAKVHIVEVRAPESLVRRRLVERSSATSESDAGWQIYLEQKKLFEEVVPAEDVIKIACPRSGKETPAGEVMDELVEKIYG